MFVPRRGGMSPDDLRRARNANNHFAKNKARTLYTQHNIILMCLNNDELGELLPVRMGVHLAGRSLDGFKANLKRVICRKFCARCAVRLWPVVNTKPNYAKWVKYITKGRACDQLNHEPEPILH